MRNKLLRKYFLMATLIVVLFLFLGVFASRWITRALEQPKDFSRFAGEILPPLFVAKIIDNINVPKKVEAIQKFLSWHQKEHSFGLMLLNQRADVLYASSNFLKQLPTPQQLKNLNNEYEYFYLNNSKNDKPRPPMPRFDFGFAGPGPGRPPFPPGPPGFQDKGDVVVKLKTTDTESFYLVISPPKPPMEMMPENDFRKYFPLIGFASLIVSLLLGIGATLFVIYISVHKKIQVADKVIEQIKSGDLKARFKIDRKDEFGEAMMRFNKMADEIENLVEHLKFVELARTKLLQELAHDLRTPIASMKSMLETLNSKHDVLKPEIRQELLELSAREVDYFEKLVEDLLLLSQVSEPNYNSEQKEVLICQLLEELVEDQSLQQNSSGQNIQIHLNCENRPLKICGNPILFQRMLRNILNNAISFARNYVQVDARQLQDGHIEITVSDDGPGFSPEQLAHYGQRKMSRQYILDQDQQKARLSIGLGSVVIKKIAQLHRGDVQVINNFDMQGKLSGAVVRVHFKK